MLRNRITLASVMVLALIFAAFFAVPALAAVGVGDKAPDFTLPNVNGNGNVTLYNYTGKPMLLTLWASWCPHCETEMPEIVKTYNDLKSKGINAVGVSADRDIKDARNFVDKLNVPFPNAFAGNEKGAAMFQAYGIDAVPTTYVLDKGGVIKAMYVGAVDAATLKKDFAKLGIK